MKTLTLSRTQVAHEIGYISDPSKHIVSIIGMDHKDTNMLRHIVQLNLTKHD